MKPTTATIIALFTSALFGSAVVAPSALAVDIFETFDGGVIASDNNDTVEWADGGSFIPWGPGVSGLLPGDHYESGQDLPNGQSSFLNLTVMIGASGGTFAFDYGLESESTLDFFRLFLDGSPIFADSGTSTSSVGPLALLPGRRVIGFQFIKDLTVSVGADAVAIDNVAVTGIIPEPTSLTLLGLGGVMLGFTRRRREKLIR